MEWPSVHSTLLVLAAAGFTALGVGEVHAQGTLATGDRVRLSLAFTSEPIEGVLIDRSDGWLTLQAADGRELRAPLGDVEVAERHSRERNFWKYFGRTQLVGTVGLSLFTGLTWEPCSWLCFTGETRAEAFLVGAVGGAVLSLPFAVVVGALVKEDRWTAVRPGGPPSALTERVRVDVRPSRSGLSLGASIVLGGGA